MRIHIAFNRVDAELELIPSHPTRKTYLRTFENAPIKHQRFILFSKNKRDEIILQQNNLIETLKKNDNEIELNEVGKFVNQTTYITVNDDFEPVYDFKLIDVLKKANGTVQERSHQKTLGNIHSELPVIITDRLYEPKELLLNYIFRKSYYITHYDGVTFKFLFDIAKWLSFEGKFAEVEAFNLKTKKRDALILVDGGRKYPRAFLEGIVKRKSYALLLHLSDQELKLPYIFQEEEVELEA